MTEATYYAVKEGWYDPETSTIKIPIKPGHFDFLVALCFALGVDAKTVFSSLLEASIEGILSSLHPHVGDAIRSVYFGQTPRESQPVLNLGIPSDFFKG